MNMLDKIESNISDNVVDKKLDPLDDIDPNKKMDRETGHRVANALNAMKESLSMDSSHKTGSALNSSESEEEEPMEKRRESDVNNKEM
ncbi:hypothetical protein CRE_09420 [Caenorhabditis remanei]|uniref:Uncharacterized protein n=1 Tax=Caenorhabditis remanei TaxID=31234 RepID=E3LIR5_CAERE|nr:hypothetical protein CRE_09420 [Caenorhabditis remanei]